MNAATPTALSISVRSTKGCWTCRLRKKKCDEIKPGCERCDSVNIECHYGSKPAWIEDSTLGKIELDRVKVLVAASASRKRAAFRAKARSESLLGGTSRSAVEHSGDVSVISNRSRIDHRHGDHSRGNTNGVEEEGSALSSKWIDDHEASLMMHYLDNVFWIQFRFHNPSIAAGGRGWLLSLLTRTKPLYHAALSLSACHQQSLISLERGVTETVYLQELERQHQLTLKELQLFIQARSLTRPPERAFDRNIQILACIVLLISFELFHGGVSNWQVHLRAASDLVLVLHNIVPSYTNIATDRPPPVTRSLSESSALSIFTACIVWFDNLSCVSTGSRSYLGEYYDRLLLTPNSKSTATIEIHTIAGCHNWVMIIINEIANLSVEAEERRYADISDTRRFSRKAHTLKLQLEAGQQSVQTELDAMRQSYNGPPPHWIPTVYNDHTVMVVTNVFASAAIIYLLAVSSPSPQILLSQIQAPLSNAIEAIRLVPDFRMFRGMIWPLCVAGCMASSPSDWEFFRRTMTGAVNDSRSFGNSGKGLEILEMSWKLQEERGHLVDCTSALRELGTCVLLV